MKFTSCPLKRTKMEVRWQSLNRKETSIYVDNGEQAYIHVYSTLGIQLPLATEVKLRECVRRVVFALEYLITSSPIQLQNEFMKHS